MISVQLPGLTIEADTVEESMEATTHFSRLIGRQEMADIAGVTAQTIGNWVQYKDCPTAPVRLCDFIAFLGKPLKRKIR